MKHIIVARHGDYTLVDGRFDNLTDKGKIQAEELAAEIQKRLKGTYFFGASNNRRTAHTARIISDIVFPANLERISELYCEDGGLAECQRIDEQIKTDADNIVLVGSQPMISVYSRYLAHKHLSQNADIHYIGEGQAAHIDLEARTWEMILPK